MLKYVETSSFCESFQVCHYVNELLSNIILQEMKPELSHLAHHCFEINKYRVETCCVVGEYDQLPCVFGGLGTQRVSIYFTVIMMTSISANFYSLQACHEKAILYFQRALRLNPRYLSAWTLMGHEYMEMKNTSAAIESYRQAIGTSSLMIY